MTMIIITHNNGIYYSTNQNNTYTINKNKNNSNNNNKTETELGSDKNYKHPGTEHTPVMI